MSLDAAPYSARIPVPYDLVRGQATTIRCPVYRDGALVSPSSGTCTVYDGSGTVVSTGATTLSSSVSTYTFTPSSTLTLGEGWRVEWALVISSITYTFRSDAALVRVALYPVIADADLFRRVSGLNPALGAAALSSLSTYQDYIDEAWTVIVLRLISKGNRPALISSPSALRECHLLLTLAFIFEDFAVRLRESFAEDAARFREHYEAEWARLSFTYDTSDTGVSPAQRRAARGPIILSGRW